MGRRRRVRHKGTNSQAERPLKHFCKTISPDNLEDKKLRMPNAFVDEFEGELSDVAKMVDPNGHVWEIGLTKSKKRVWFDNGWHEFVQHYSICSGCLLVFGYRGSSNFSVLICDMTACEIQYPYNDGIEGTEGPTNREKISTGTDNGVAEDDDHAEILGSTYLHALSRRRILKGKTSNVESSKGDTAEEQNQEINAHRPTVGPSMVRKFKLYRDRGKKRIMEEQVKKGTYDACTSKREKFSEEGNSRARTPLVVNEMKDGEYELLPKRDGDAEVINSSMFTSGFRNASQKSERAIHTARKFKTKNPSLMVVLRPYHLCRSLLYLPGEFSKKYMSNVPAYIILRVSDGREWVARICRTRGSLTIGSGWRCFFRENNLDEGDVLVFEWIKKHITMKISIFHAVQDNGMGETSARVRPEIILFELK